MTFSFCFKTTHSTLKQSAQNGVGVAEELRCVAKNNAEDSGVADCGPIQQGGHCYDPADIQRTASYAFNDYFLKHGLTEDSCNFRNAAALLSIPVMVTANSHQARQARMETPMVHQLWE